ncbi:hypothetical protein HYY71_06140 [Candidatus Woesearchaeota archaeon]|nr:hypothetical protein [Candidatus Woesearchaeota archaeon]
MVIMTIGPRDVDYRAVGYELASLYVSGQDFSRTVKIYFKNNPSSRYMSYGISMLKELFEGVGNAIRDGQTTLEQRAANEAFKILSRPCRKAFNRVRGSWRASDVERIIGEIMQRRGRR